jgi:hypothetical protein
VITLLKDNNNNMLKPYDATMMIEKVKKKDAICIICISLTDFPEPSSALASVLYHFEPDNDFAIRCIL